MSKYFIISLLTGSITAVAFLIPVNNEVEIEQFHTSQELKYFQQYMVMPPPIDSSILFPSASICGTCHDYDEMGLALVDGQGNDVNIYSDWRSSMMANSAKDPFWRAKVSHEVLINPQIQATIETSCTSCHAPQGHHTALLRGAEHYSIQEMLLDTIAMDGVSCSTCHKIAQENLGEQHSGAMTFDTSRIIFGPYPGPFADPMELYAGMSPVYAPHINDAGICASCHTLLVETLDLEGTPTGEHFVEQATYHEWLNSIYEEEQSCQSCHIPQLEEEVIIANGSLMLEGRAPFGLHDLVGGNTFMLKLMKEHRATLGIDASEEDYDETIAKTMNMLQTQTLLTSLVRDTILHDTAYFTLSLRNRAGHKFPSGYPSRRAFVEFVVTDEATGDTLFKSGVLRSDFEVEGQDAHFEPHYDVISQSDQVQIYQFVTGDVNGQFTTVLEHGAVALKDNRLPPVGFTTTHEVYDTTRIAGNALTDPDFNIENGLEGSGKDLVHYHIPLNGFSGNINVSARVYYQSLPPKWLAPMFAESSPEIELFRDMYDNADQSPVLISEDTLQSVFIMGENAVRDLAQPTILVYPNPSFDGTFSIQSINNERIISIKAYTTNGQKVLEQRTNLQVISLVNAGIYFLEIQTEKGILTRKIVVE